jgi:hypothetical protein
MLFATLAVTNMPAPVLAAADPDDREGGRDHPMFTRMPNYHIDNYKKNNSNSINSKTKTVNI